MSFSEAAAELDLRLERGSTRPLALALSGGSDSLALLQFAAAWCATAERPLLALTVDHGLSPDSAAWTAFARDAAQAVGADWSGLAWTGPKPSTGLPARARAVRHALLAEAARAAGARVILVAHTRDDVLEGERMRAADAPGLGRLRPWSPSPAWPEGRGIFLHRPLLGIRRAALRAWLSAQGLAWIDDPANADPRFARARARLAVDELAPPESAPPLPLPAEPTPDGGLRLSREILQAAAPGAARHALRSAAVCVGGGDRPPRGDTLERLLARVAAGEAGTATLAGARAETSADGVRFLREPGEQRRSGLAPLALEPGGSVVWDGRFELSAETAGLMVRPLAGLIARLPPGERAALRELPPSARAALPCVTDGAGAVRLPAPFGEGPASARPLAAARYAAASGAITREAEL